jgi:hypothetical protein
LRTSERYKPRLTSLIKKIPFRGNAYPANIRTS